MASSAGRRIRLAALLAAVSIAATACASTGPTGEPSTAAPRSASPQRSDSAAPSAPPTTTPEPSAEALASPVATRPPLPFDALPTVAPPAGAVHRLLISGASFASSAVASGSTIYSVGWGSGTDVRAAVTDVASGSHATAAVSLPSRGAGEAVCAVAAGSRWLVLMTARDLAAGGHTRDCSGYDGGPFAWRLLAVRLDAGVPGNVAMLVASGTSRHRVWPTGEGNASTVLPSVAVEGDELAYTADAPATASLPWRSAVFTRDLRSGAAVRRAVTNGQPYHLVLSGGVLAWSERLDRRDVPSLSVWALPMSATRPTQVWRRASATSGEAPDVAVGQAGLAWDDPSGGSVWFSGLTHPAPARLPPSIAAGQGWCSLGDLVGHQVVELCHFDWIDADSVNRLWQATILWSPATGPKVLEGDPALMPAEDLGSSPSFGGGWVIAPDGAPAADGSGLVVAASLASVGG